MKNIIEKKITRLLAVAFGSCSLLGACSEDINNYEKETASEASNKVFFSEELSSIAFTAQRSTTGDITNMDTLVAKLVVNCTTPAVDELKVRVAVDTALVEVYNAKHETDYIQFNTAFFRLNKHTLTIEPGNTESTDTLEVALVTSLNRFDNQRGYLLPIHITSATGYDTGVDFNKRISYLTLDVIQENGIGFEEGNNFKVLSDDDEIADDIKLPLVAYMVSNQDVNIELEIDNELVADYNNKYGTDYKVLQKMALKESTVILPAGSIECNAQLVYTGNAATLDGNYLVPVKLHSLSVPSSTLENSSSSILKPLETNVFYLIINHLLNGKLSVVSDASWGIKADNSLFKVISPNPTENAGQMGTWGAFLTNGFVTQNPKPITIDLGQVVSNINGIYFKPLNASSTLPGFVSVAYAGEEMYNELPVAYSIGSLKEEIARNTKEVFIKFDTPLSARYLTVTFTANSYMKICGVLGFSIYTKNNYEKI